MTDRPNKQGVSRRGFLIGAGAGATAVATAQMATPANAMDPGPEASKARYRLSDEVKTYYRVNGYERSK